MAEVKTPTVEKRVGGGSTVLSEGVVLIGVGLVAFTLIYLIRTVAQGGAAIGGGLTEAGEGAANWLGDGMEYWEKRRTDHTTDYTHRLLGAPQYYTKRFFGAVEDSGEYYGKKYYTIFKPKGYTIGNL